jgi:predicted ABC-type transport system involved in lysophospholipase L1 biosynthesis ATPase subunit
MSFLELRHVSKIYGAGPTEVQAIADVTLSVDRGELVAVMGPSGSGQSTLLTIAGSLEEPTSGQVLIDGAPLSKMSCNDKARLRRRSVGYVFQDFNLLAGLTAGAGGPARRGGGRRVGVCGAPAASHRPPAPGMRPIRALLVTTMVGTGRN